MKTKLIYSLIATSFCFTSLNTWADPNAPLPGLGGELGVISAPSAMSYGAYGPQVNLNAPTFEQIPNAVYFEKNLEQQLTDKTLKIFSLKISHDPELNLENE